MVDKISEDFLDSDDDEFFLEASHHFIDDGSITESTQIPENNTLQNHSEVNASVYFKSNDNIASEIQKHVADTNKISSEGCEIAVKDTMSASKSSTESSANNISDYSKKSTERHTDALQNTLNKSKSLDINSSAVLWSPQKEHAKDVTNINVIASTSAELNQLQHSSNVSHLNKTPVTSDNLSYIDSRFTPGFTPKAKKRKFPGPAGLFDMFDESNEVMAGSSEEMFYMDFEIENIVSSQFTPEYLSSISWQKLQTAVSSCPNLHSTVKHYSIQRVLQESSKKKLPKHLVVPFLCVLLKKINYKGSATGSVFMDDTGEINGKIDAGVLSTYRDYLVEGSALILNKVTFLCNVLILKAQNIVSLYHPDGTEKYLQSLNSILKTSEPLKPMNCDCLKLLHHNIKNDKHKTLAHNTPNGHKLGCFNHSQNRFHNISSQNKALPVVLDNNSTPKMQESDVCYNQKRFNTVLSQNNTVNKTVSSSNSDERPHVNETSSHIKSVRSDASLENLLDEDSCIDEFDELLGNLDEKSFMDDF